MTAKPTCRDLEKQVAALNRGISELRPKEEQLKRQLETLDSIFRAAPTGRHGSQACHRAGQRPSLRDDRPPSGSTPPAECPHALPHPGRNSVSRPVTIRRGQATDIINRGYVEDLQRVRTPPGIERCPVSKAQCPAGKGRFRFRARPQRFEGRRRSPATSRTFKE